MKETLESFGYKILLTTNGAKVRHCKGCGEHIHPVGDYYLIWTPQTTVILDNMFCLCRKCGDSFVKEHSLKIEEWNHVGNTNIN